MTNDDINVPEDFEEDFVEKPSLKEVWENNPMLKLASIVLVGAILIGGFMIFFSDDDGERTKATLRGVQPGAVSQVPGQEDLDPAYKAALEEKNKREAEEAARTGKSALPVPTSPAKIGGIEVPEMPMMPDSLKTDVLSAWRKAAEAKRTRAAQDAIEEENGMLTPEGVPMVQPIRPQQGIGGIGSKVGVSGSSAASTAKDDAANIKSISDQMRVIVAAQEPLAGTVINITGVNSLYEIQKSEENKLKSGSKESLKSSGVGKGGKNKKSDNQVIVSSGDIAYAQLLIAINSDIGGPALAQILSGPFVGGRVIGKVEVKGEYIVIEFSRIIKDTVSYTISGIALDENTTLAGQATDVDHHYFTRVLLPAAAKFVEGYGSAVAQTGTTVTQIAGGGQAIERPKPDAKESIYKGLEESVKVVSEILEDSSDRPITVHIAKGTTMGIFFINSVTTKDAEK